MLVVFRRRFLLRLWLCLPSSGPLAMGPTIFSSLPLVWSLRAGSLPHLPPVLSSLVLSPGLPSRLFVVCAVAPVVAWKDGPFVGVLGGLIVAGCGFGWGGGCAALRGGSLTVLVGACCALRGGSVFVCSALLPSTSSARVFGGAFLVGPPDGPVVGAVAVVALLPPTFH